MTKYWVAAANPKIYNIEQAINESEIDLWTTKNSDVSIGDRLLIWKTLGNSDKRGIICLGEVLDDPIIRTDSENHFWVNKKDRQSLELRANVRYIKSPNLPIWVGESNDNILLNLSVAKSQGGTIFKVSSDQWDEILNTIGGWPNDI